MSSHNSIPSGEPCGSALRAIKLYNTLVREVQTLETVRPGEVGLYCCGPTVYDYPHIGNMRTYLFEDLLVRMLRYAGYRVKHVMNITDVGHLVSDADSGDDKMVVAMKREKKRSYEIADYYTGVFMEHCKALNICTPDIVCKATDHIHEMIDLIGRIEEKTFTYEQGGNVYFDISKLPDYGKLAKLDLAALQAGARIEVDQNKRNPADFVLWFTKSKFENHELEWESPWGTGYPGWHIECSAMALKYLGEEIDIHCGGIDHVPVHHTNEIAQSEAATGKPWVRVWMHGEFLVLSKEKMSKSKAGFLTLSTLTEKGFDPLVYRYMCLGAHYRTQLNFSWEAVEGAANGFEKLKRAVLSVRGRAGGETIDPTKPVYQKCLREFEEAIFNDLNTPRALATVWGILGEKGLNSAEKYDLLHRCDAVLGFDVEEWREAEEEIPVEVQGLLAQRQEARAAKDWGRSDEIRDQIATLGYVVEDSAEGVFLRRRGKTSQG